MEDFTVTTRLENVSVRDAVRQVCGFYPMHLTFDHQDIYIECTQKEDTKVIGRVVDDSGNPIEFANITLLNDGFVNGGISNENGDFVIPCKTQSIEIPQYKMTQGGMTVDVQHSILHDIGTADDLLSMMPMMKGKDGKFEVLAKGEPEIYINNKKVRDKSELKQLKSVDIKSVDVITAPGAQYNAEVNAVIRIKTMKTQGDGLSLMVTSDTWKNNKWSSYNDLTLKYRTGGLEVSANVALDNSHYSADQVGRNCITRLI